MLNQKHLATKDQKTTKRNTGDKGDSIILKKHLIAWDTIPGFLYYTP